MDRAPATVDVAFEERYWYPDDGGVVWVAGYQVVDPASGRFVGRDAPQLAARSPRVSGVAGTAGRADPQPSASTPRSRRRSSSAVAPRPA